MKFYEEGHIKKGITNEVVPNLVEILQHDNMNVTNVEGTLFIREEERQFKELLNQQKEQVTAGTENRVHNINDQMCFIRGEPLQDDVTQDNIVERRKITYTTVHN